MNSNGADASTMSKARIVPLSGVSAATCWDSVGHLPTMA